MNSHTVLTDYFIMWDLYSWVNILGDVVSILSISSCLFLKVPQIRHIQARQSADGIYPQAICLEITAYTIMMLYSFTNNYAILTYLEYPIILVQTYGMLYLVLKYNNQLHNLVVPGAAFVYVTLLVCFMNELLPCSILSYLVPCCTPFNAFAKLAYIYGIIKAGNAEAVSITTWIISIATNASRIFTVYLDSKDAKLLFNFTFSMCLSTGVLLTSLYYKYYGNTEIEVARPTQTRRKSQRHCHCD